VEEVLQVSLTVNRRAGRSPVRDSSCPDLFIDFSVLLLVLHCSVLPTIPEEFKDWFALMKEFQRLNVKEIVEQQRDMLSEFHAQKTASVPAGPGTLPRTPTAGELNRFLQSQRFYSSQGVSPPWWTSNVLTQTVEAKL
jgi:hypothetical protein